MSMRCWSWRWFTIKLYCLRSEKSKQMFAKWFDERKLKLDKSRQDLNSSSPTEGDRLRAISITTRSHGLAQLIIGGSKYLIIFTAHSNSSSLQQCSFDENCSRKAIKIKHDINSLRPHFKFVATFPSWLLLCQWFCNVTSLPLVAWHSANILIAPPGRTETGGYTVAIDIGRRCNKDWC